VAALTSTISLLEVPTAFLIDEHKWRREKAATVIGAAAFILGIPSALSNGASPWLTKINLMMKMDLVFGNIMLAVGGLLITIFVAYVWGIPQALKEISHGTTRFKIKPLWIFSVKVLSPLAIIAILVFTIFFA